MLDITTSAKEDWCVIAVRGRADATAADLLEAALVEAAETNQQVAVDFSALDYISSAGLRAVLQGARAAQLNNTAFAICASSPPVKKVMEMSGMDRIIRMQGDLPC